MLSRSLLLALTGAAAAAAQNTTSICSVPFASLFLPSVCANTTAPVTDSIFNNIVRYTQFAGAAYAEDCPSIPYNASVLQTFNDTNTDIHAVLFYDSAANEVILAFRGSSAPRNLDQDFSFTLVPLNLTGTSCSGCQVHQGFQSVYAAIQGSVATAVKSALSAHFFSKLTVTGHSLGAGIAALASSSLKAQGVNVDKVYTFGEPRNGNPAFTTYINSQISPANYFRVTHYNDGVPQIPPEILGFEHHGTEYWESKQSGNTAATTYQCAGTEPTQCNAGQDFGESPINGAHIAYTNQLIAGVLYNPACGYRFPQ